MARLRSALSVFLVVGACRALPSASPLADVGEGREFEDGALSINRVASPDRKSGFDDSDSSDLDADETISVVAAGRVDAGDAGVPEAGLLTSDAGDGGPRWAGEYFGKDRHTTRISGKTEDEELDDKAHTRVEETAPGVALISLVSSASGEVICSMKHRATGNRAELEPGESCPPLRLLAPLTLEGTAKLEGDTLVVSLQGRGTFPAGDVEVEYSFEGKRR
jgi:hypothetical protein